MSPDFAVGLLVGFAFGVLLVVFGSTVYPQVQRSGQPDVSEPDSEGGK